MSTYEHALIGRALIDPGIVPETGLFPIYFANSKLAEVWGNILHRRDTGKPVGPVEVAADFSDPVTTLTLLTECTVNAAFEGTHASYADQVRLEYQRRRLSVALADAQNTLHSAELPDVISNTIATLEKILRLSAVDRPNMRTEIEEEIEAVISGTGLIQGLPTGLGINRVVPGGLPSDKVTVLFGETGTFKTTLKANIIDGIANSGRGHIIDFTLEDSNELTRQRAIARASGVSYGKFACREFTDDDIGRITQVKSSVYDKYNNVTVISDGLPSPDEIIRVARQTKGVCAVFIDYIQMLDWGRRDEREMLTNAMYKFQRAALRDRVAYVVVSQLNDDKLHARERRDARPELRDLFGSSTIRNACKLAIATYRPAKYGPPKSPTDKQMYGELYSTNEEEYADIIELIVRKNVIGESDKRLRVTCNRTTGLMEQYTE